MTRERWQQIEALYNSARESGPGVLAGVAPDLRREVERLLEQDSDGKILDRPAGEIFESSTVTQFVVGLQLGPYRIEAPLGAGGMGDVFRARDTRLDRAVAVKICREQFSDRFHREARAISSLNHPNICNLYDVGPGYLVMELVEGETLLARLKRGKLSIEQTIRYSSQIAAALAAAHAKGIVHRDLKPANIMLAKSGVKILDFGLAKSSRDESLTTSHMVVGTPAYMAPEQREGKECDARTDIYAFGLVLREMATGDREASTATLPVHLAHVIERCLDPDPEQRWQAASDVAKELEWSSATPAKVSRTSRPSPKAAIVIGWVMAGLICVAVFIFLIARPLPAPRVSGYARITNDGAGKGGVFGAAVTDGSRIYFAEESASESVIAQVSTAGGETALLPVPFTGPEVLDISPSRSELLVASTYTGGAFRWPLWVVPVPAGTPRRVGNVLTTGAAWSPDGREIAYITGQDLYRANTDGSGARKLTTLPRTAFWLRWSPDGSRLRMTLGNVIDRTGELAIWEVSADGTGLHALRPNRPATECCGNWTPDGKYFVFQAARNGRTDIWATRERGGLLGLVRKPATEPVQLTAGQLNSLTPIPSPDGKKLYVIGQQLRGELVRYDSKSRQWAPYLSGISADNFDFSPDGQWISYISFPEGDLWRSRIDGSERLQLTVHPLRALSPYWSPDNQRILFQGGTGGLFDGIYLTSAEGGMPEELLKGHNRLRPNWSPDGNSIVFSYALWVETVPRAIEILNLRTRRIGPVPGSEGLLLAAWSPDGRYLTARRADHRALMLFDLKTQTWTELAKGPLNWANWSRDGRHVYFERGGTEHTLMRVRLNDHEVEQVVSLKDIKRTGASGGYWFGLTPDDSPLILRDTGTQEVYALNWQEPIP